MSQHKSNLAKSAEGYVASFLRGDSFPGGFAYREQLNGCRLDFTLDSLNRIDTLLDHLRKRQMQSFETFMENPANQHFLHFIAFYAGKVTGMNVGVEPEWYTREEAIARVPQLQNLWPDDFFETSIICMFPVKGGGSQQYPPLLSVCTRLFEGETKSVWGSACGIKFAMEKMNTRPSGAPPSTGTAPSRAAPQPKRTPPESLFSKFRRILNS